MAEDARDTLHPIVEQANDFGDGRRKAVRRVAGLEKFE